MALECNGCGAKTASKVIVYFHDKEKREICNCCENITMSISNTDVYWEGPGYNRGICDDNGKPIYLESKSHKIKLMKERGLREAGDMWRGTRGTETQKVESLKQDRMREHKEQVKNAGRIFRDGLRKLKS